MFGPLQKQLFQCERQSIQTLNFILLVLQEEYLEYVCDHELLKC